MRFLRQKQKYERMVKMDMNYNLVNIEKHIKKWSKVIIISIVALFTIAPFGIAMFYTLPAADDFAYTNDIMQMGGHNLKGVINFIKLYYFNWEGIFYVNIVEGFIDPLGRWGTVGIKFYLLISFMAFLFISYLVIKHILKSLGDMNKLDVILIFVLLFTGYFNIRPVSQLFFWVTGSCNYVIPLLTGEIGVLCLFKYIKCEHKVGKRIFLGISVLFGFLCGGGNLQVAGFICWIYLLFFMWSIMHKYKTRNIFLTFCSAVSGALLNTLAPGNYIRQEVNYESISVFKAMWYTMVSILNEIVFLMSETYIPFVMLAIFVLLLISRKKITKTIYNPFLIMCTVVCGWMISTFPVCYGYANSTLAERGYNILDIYILLGMLIILDNIVGWIKTRNYDISKEFLLLLSIFAVLLGGYLQNSIPLYEIPSMQCIKQLVSGELKEYHDEWLNVYKAIEKSDEKIVEVSFNDKIFEKNVVIMHPGMSYSFDNWVNKCIATYYGKEKVRLASIEE